MLTILFAAVAALAAPSAQADWLLPFSSDRNDYNLSMDRAEQVAVFARSDADFANARILVSRKRHGRWSEPEPIAFTDPRFSDTDPWLTPDGRTLYFVSNRPAESGVGGDLDIWRSHRTARGWSAPEHLGSEVNGRGPELGPELHRGVLTFSAVRKGGKGGLDIYAAPQRGDGFGQAEPLPGPFNSAESDSDFTVSPDGRSAAFWRGSSTAKIMLVRRERDGWGEPVSLPAGINLGPFNFTPHFTRDGRSLTFASTASRKGQPKGLADIFVAKLPAMPK